MAYNILDKAGGRPILVSAGGRPLLNAADGAGTGAGTGTGTGGGGTAVPPTGGTSTYTGTIEALRLMAAVPTLPVPLGVHAEEAIANPPVCCGHGFGPGDVPNTHRVRLRTSSGAEIGVQQDGETRWPDGSLKYCVLSFVAPDSFAAAQTINYTVDAVAGAPNRTASYTLAQLAGASDFRVEIRGHSLAAAVGVLSVNELIAANRIGSWGTNPKGGVEVIASGPICQDWRFWTVAKRKSDGAYHESIRLELYLRRWAATGAFQLIGRQRQPNLDAAYYGSTWSTSTWNRGNANIMEGFNGTTLVFAMGGPNDRDARTVAASAWNATDSTYTIPAGQNLGQASGIGTTSEGQWYGFGVSVGVSGNLPGGVSATDVLFTTYMGGDRKTRFTRLRNDGNGAVTITSQPAGNSTVYPLIHSWPGAGAVAADIQGDPFWSGPGAAPRVRVAHDLPYLTRSTRLFAPMDLSQPRPAEPAGYDNAEWPFHPYRSGQVVDEWQWDWGRGGDNWDRDRIGWLSRQHANLLLTPLDRRRRTHCIATAFSQADKLWDWEDQRSARVPCVNNGPNDSGNAYPEMSPPQPSLFLNHRTEIGARSATPGFWALANSNDGGSGYYASLDRYGPINEASHYPQWQIVPHLLTGHRVFLDIARTNTASIFASTDDYKKNKTLLPPVVPTARNFRAIFYDQPRSNGWARLALSNLRHTLPDNHPERPYYDDVARDSADYWGLIAPYSPHRLYGHVMAAPQDGNMANYILPNYTDFDYWYGDTGFHQVYAGIGTLMTIFRGESGYNPEMDVFLGFLRDIADDTQSPNGTGWFTGIYGAPFHDGTYFYQSRQEWIERFSLSEAGASPPFPADRNLAGDNRRTSYDKYLTTKYDVQQVAVLALAAWIAKPDGTARFPGCDRVRQQLITRLAGTGVDRYRFADNARPGETNFQWAIVPPGL